ncbi:CdiA family toxin C-terminal domain-containing protein [Bacillus sp. DX1.1]|nr:CdiA family toxin C-terminal domain-containing protein [Bacillus sp. DX1.1]MDM5154709.1 CdiA family toxin C-terminal domain-containing protein [Bacillus sp. DX1.1]
MNFIKLCQGNSIDDLIVSKRPHPTIEGVYEVNYQIPRKDMAGNIAEPVTCKIIKEPKTVYDPSVISDDVIYQWGTEAMKKGTINGTRVEGTASNGLRFFGYLDESGNVKNFYPILD